MAIQTVGDLIAYLEDLDPEAPVMIAHQPNWPLAEVVRGVVSPADREIECPVHEGYLVDHGYRGEDGEYHRCTESPVSDSETDNTVWLVAGGHHHSRSPYAPRWVFGS